MTDSGSTIATPMTNASDTLDAITDTATDDKVALSQIAEFIDEINEVLSRARSVRDYTALRLREFGVPGRHIADLARVTDSYLARKAIAAGAEPRVHRAGA